MSAMVRWGEDETAQVGCRCSAVRCSAVDEVRRGQRGQLLGAWENDVGSG
jgi:hypothetical protein